MSRRGAITAACAALMALLACAPARAATPPNLFGVAAVTYPTQAQFDQMARAGIKVCRVQFFWGSVEPSPGARNFAATDAIVTSAARAGITLLPDVNGSPSWITSKPTRPPLASAGQRAAWQELLREWAARYGTTGTFWSLHPEVPRLPVVNWEIWNEPNLAGFWGGKPNARAFAKLLRISAAGLRAGDPGANVISGGVFPQHTIKNTVAMDRYLRAFYRVPGVRDSFDALGVHPYGTSPKAVIHWIREARRLMRAHGDGGTPIWATEFGWSTGGVRWKYSPYRARPRQQARRLARTYNLLKKRAAGLGVASAEWFSFTDVKAEPDFWTHHEGLFTTSGAPKPSWYAYARVAGGSP